MPLQKMAYVDADSKPPVGQAVARASKLVIASRALGLDLCDALIKHRVRV